MTGADELRKRREQEALKIRTALNRQRGEQRANTKGGEGTVAFVEERKCIGCDQCTIVCDDDAIELITWTCSARSCRWRATAKPRSSETHARAAGCAFLPARPTLSR